MTEPDISLMSIAPEPAAGSRDHTEYHLDLRTLRAVIDTVIPPDDWPGGWDGGVQRLLEAHGADFLEGEMPVLARACATVDETARELHGVAFAEATPSQQRSTIEHDSMPLQAIDPLVSLAFKGFYAGTSAPTGWKMLGFDPGPTHSSSDDLDVSVPLSRVEGHYDVVVIGAGAGGGVAAAELAEKGARVLVVERAQPMRASDLRSDHLRGKRMQTHSPLAGPGAGNPRLLELPDGTTSTLLGEGDGGEYGLVAMTLGGGTRLWQGMSWRFHPEDFRMATVYGVPEDSTLSDWPFAYEDLEPFYDRVEWELGVSGDASSDVSRRTPRTRPYPMAPLPDDAVRLTLRSAASVLKWRTSPVPFAINSVPRDGRAACSECGQCVGHACPVNAKNGTHNTFLPRAIASGLCDVVMSSQVVEILHDGEGRASGVRIRSTSDSGQQTQERVVHARIVIVAAGAIETARLLLASGLGNDWVGRNHHTHGIAVATAIDGPAFPRRRGPGHSVASVDWVHRDGLAWGGGAIFDAPEMYPYAKAIFGSQAVGHRWGSEHKAWMRDTGSPLGTMSMVQEIPHSSSRVSIDRQTQDRNGMPVPRLRGESHRATREAVSFMSDRCVEWLEAAGARSIASHTLNGAPQGAEHSAGTTRMASDPALGACSPEGRLFGTSNVFVADASLHPTNGGFNPGLTVMANAMRVASMIEI